MTYRIAFMGTPDFAAPALAALIEAGHEIACVYTQPPRPAGRGKKERQSPVAAFADERGLDIRDPASLKSREEQDRFAALDLDVAVVAAYGLILPNAVLEAPRQGCVNIHASLLPRWRGAAPIQRAIQAGDEKTGITIMRVEEALDCGPILLRESMPIGSMNGGELHDALAAMGARMIVEALARMRAGGLGETPQPGDGATYAHKIDKRETRLDWTLPAAVLERAVRAFAPAPGAWFDLGGERVKVLESELAQGGGAPGTVLDECLTVACGEGALRLTTVQRAGKAPMDSRAFLRGCAAPAGTVLG